MDEQHDLLAALADALARLLEAAYREKKRRQHDDVKLTA